MSRRLLLGAVTLATFAACSRAPHSSPPAPKARAERTERVRRNPNVYAADGMCSDKLAESFERHQKLLGGIRRTMRGRLKTYEEARAKAALPWYRRLGADETRAAEALMYTFAFWRDVHRPFQQRYGEFWCVRRRDLMVLSSDVFVQGIDEIWKTVQHLGPLPPEQHFVIED